MKVAELQALLVHQAISRALAVGGTAASQRDLAYYFIKATGAQARTRKLYTVSQACVLLLHSLDSGVSFRELRKRYPYVKKDVELIEVEKEQASTVEPPAAPSSTPASNTGYGPRAIQSQLPLQINPVVLSYLEEYI